MACHVYNLIKIVQQNQYLYTTHMHTHSNYVIRGRGHLGSLFCSFLSPVDLKIFLIKSISNKLKANCGSCLTWKDSDFCPQLLQGSCLKTPGICCLCPLSIRNKQLGGSAWCWQAGGKGLPGSQSWEEGCQHMQCQETHKIFAGCEMCCSKSMGCEVTPRCGPECQLDLFL